ncbi:NYN domain-containing protein [Shewanella alkalitolerans]|uniref:NYN domain-containing protein n=1 Tax=Shewanella alkalitolerans TaxID=2864209 RepID=UPI001C65BDF8|nr:NYN domain-containing protein [Shewanella alkalitolerans]QYJ96528.1 NYN domain-containing protein [Shewanella alkalitolerans]
MSKTIMLIDGENLVLRFDALVKAGRTPKSDVVYRDGIFIWSDGLCGVYAWDMMRVSYYSTFVGDDDALEELCRFISATKFTYEIDAQNTGRGTLNPHIFKKTKRSTKAKSVDINITIDALRHAYARDVERIIICSGDGDYQPLISEIMRQGVIAHVAAFSDGCHPKMRYIADDFTDLDEIYFEKNI